MASKRKKVGGNYSSKLSRDIEKIEQRTQERVEESERHYLETLRQMRRSLERNSRPQWPGPYYS